MTAVFESGTVVAQETLSHDIRRMEIHLPKVAQTAQPGQFVTVRVNHLHDPLLRRPFGVAGVDVAKGNFSLIYRVVGETTELMETLEPGAEISVVGPLGHGFDLSARHGLLVGGGVGLAPLHFLAQADPGHKMEVIVGGRTKAEVFWSELFRDKTARQYETTDDGSYGVKGTVNAVLPDLLKTGQYDCVYVCGPSPMMKAVVKVVKTYGVPCQVSLEKYMGCGLGACLSCSC
ncbi:dihydroorotate dehydrogenase electron transfer subunit, partial [Acidaminococcus timonensis]